jgi:hypothetical protein
MSEREVPREAPAKIEQVAAAMAALGLYDGGNTPKTVSYVVRRTSRL